MGRTSIQASDELADELHDRKRRGDSYEDVIWRLIETADSAEDIADSSSSPDEAGPEIVVEPGPGPDDLHENVQDDAGDPWPADADRSREHVRASIEEIDFPVNKDREECFEAVLAAYRHLRNEEKASMREFVRIVMPQHPLGYDVPELEQGERYRGAWWRRVIKPALEQLPDVEAPPAGGSHWRIDS